MSRIKEYTLLFRTNDERVFPVKYQVRDGKNAYEVWKDLPGNKNKSEEDYLLYIRGPKGNYVTSVSVTVTHSHQ